MGTEIENVRDHSGNPVQGDAMKSTIAYIELRALFYKLKHFFNGQFILLKNRNLKASFGVRSHLTAQERVQLYKLSRQSCVIVEIGSYVGASACCFGVAAKEHGEAKVICIDTWNNDAMTEGGRNTWDEFTKNTVEFKDFIIPVRGFSTDVVDAVSNSTSSADLLFIDGDHSYGGVKADWEAYKHLLNPGSVVIFHDYGWAEGVQRVVHEDVMPLVEHHGSLPNMWWGTLAKNP